MGMVINTNVSSLTAQRHLASSRADMEQAMERLSSGTRINSAMDDAAGLTIAHSLDSKIASLSQAVRNANDGIALVQLAEGALDEVSAMLTRMKELATQASNGTYSTTDLSNLNKEYEQLSAEIKRISENTKFNTIAVLDSSSKATFQVGDTSADTISVNFQETESRMIGGAKTVIQATLTDTTASTGEIVDDMTAGDYLKITVAGRTFVQQFDTDTGTTIDNLIGQVTDAGIAETVTSLKTIATAAAAPAPAQYDVEITLTAAYAGSAITDLERYDGAISGQSIASASGAQSALASIDRAIAEIDSYRANLGAVANRMEHASSNLMSRVEHQQSARSRIQDADYAVESANLAKAQVLQQAGTAMLAQANASSQNILSLLK